ncbi:hypothetical protein [Mesorhizobium sp. 1B3]|uniref:hypothetical protein n=1 Tax=Mesorhizobium sp. 1B3 TaxID=3243599 RepID=UPI003D972457
MKPCFVVIGLLSVGGLASMTAPAFSETPIRALAEWSPVRPPAGLGDSQPPLVRLAQAEADREQGPKRMSDRGGDRAGPRGCCRGEMPRMGRMGHHGEAHRRGPVGLRIAARLAQTETYVGITSAQLDVWRAYTSALIDFFERPARDRDEGGPRPSDAPPPPSQDEAGPAPADAGPALFADRLADRAIARADKARALKTALDALRAQLTPEQLDRLMKADRAFGPHRRHHDSGGPHHRQRAGMPSMSPEDMPAASPGDMPEASPQDMPDTEEMPTETPEDTSPEDPQE